MDVIGLDASADGPRRAAWHALAVAVAAEPGWPEPPTPRAQLDGWLDHPGEPGEAEHVRCFVALDGDAVVGDLTLWPATGENAHLATAVVAVHPQHRRRGIGRALLQHAAEVARPLGVRLLELGAPRGGPGEAFLDAVGARRGLLERQSELGLDDLDGGQLQRLARPADGHRLEPYAALPSDEQLTGMAVVRASMHDAPQGSLSTQRQTFRADGLRAEYALLERRREAVIGLTAVHDASGEVAGYTELRLRAPGERVAMQDNTVVAPAHRGHRLGMALKAANLLQLQAVWPDVTRVITWNADDNGYMLAVNVELGFRATAHWVLAELPV